MDAIEKHEMDLWNGEASVQGFHAALAQAWDACYRSQMGLLHDPENPYGGA